MSFVDRRLARIIDKLKTKKKDGVPPVHSFQTNIENEAVQKAFQFKVNQALIFINTSLMYQLRMNVCKRMNFFLEKIFRKGEK